MDQKKALILTARMALSAGLLLFLFLQLGDFEFSELLPDWNRSTMVWLIAALVLTIASMVMAAIRWREVAHVVGISDVPFRRFLSHFFAGQFLSNFFPTTVGGDVLRISRLSRDVKNAPRAFASVVFERLSGWFVLPAISLVGFLANSELRNESAAARLAMIAVFVTLVGLMLVVLIAGSDRLGSRLATHEGWLEWINAVHVGLASLRAHPRHIWRALGAAFCYQIVLMTASWCALQALGIDEVGVTAFLAFFPAVLILQVLPLGIGGLGVREGAFVLFFGSVGVEDPQSIAFGFLLYLLTIASSLLGLPVLMFGGRSSRTRDEATDEFQAAVAGQ